MQSPDSKAQRLKMKDEKSVQGLEAEETRKCPDCGSKDLVKEKGETYCKKCGFVID